MRKKLRNDIKGRSKWFVFLVMFLFFGVGLIILTLGISITRERIGFLRESSRTVGRIVDVISVYGRSTSGRLYSRSNFLVVEYFVDGERYTDRSQVSVGGLLISSKLIGKDVGVYYEPANPQMTILDTFLEKWFETVVTLGLGGAFVIISLSAMVMLRGWRMKKVRVI